MYNFGKITLAKLTNRGTKYLKRWPERPKILVFGPPNVPLVKLSQRLAIDVGVPVINMDNEFEKIKNQAGKNEDFNHPFYVKVKEILQSEDKELISKEKLGVKLLRVNEYAQDGFILHGFPDSIKDAESLEELDGGMNAFVHINMPELFLAKIESTKYEWEDCGAIYWRDDVVDEETGTVQKSNYPDDGFCSDCGSIHIKPATDPDTFEKNFQTYLDKKDELLEFYNYLGLLVDIDLQKGGLQDYEKVKQKVQFNIKF